MASNPVYLPEGQPVIEKSTGLMTRSWFLNLIAAITQAAAAGPGNVTGPALSTDNAIARWDGATGQLLQNSGITVADAASGTLSGTNTGDVTLAGTPTYLTIAGQVITRALINLTSMVTGVLPIANGGGLSGTYTPTLTNVANLDASTAFVCQYLQVGATVTVSGKVNVDPTTTLTLTQLGISLPIASNFAAAEQCGGVAFASGIASQGAAMLADATNDRAQLTWIATDITNQSMYFSFTYQVI